MIGAKKARGFTNSFENPDLLFKPGKLARLTEQLGMCGNGRILRIICAGIYDNIRNGFYSTITYHPISDAVRSILESHQFAITQETDDKGLVFHVISWESDAV
jgi:hypothetical protein